MRKFYLMSKGYNFNYIQFLQPHIYKKANLTESEKKSRNYTIMYGLFMEVRALVNF